MSRPAVESTLFRARRRLTEEFDDIVSGARCLRIQTIIMTAADGRLGARDTRRLARHLSHCQTCRREALAAGLDRGLFTRPPVRERIAARVAGFLPFPIFERFRRGADASPPPSAVAAPRSPRTCRCSPTSSRAVGERPPPEPPCWSRAWVPASGCSRWRSRRRSRPRSAHNRRRTRPARARSSPRKRLRRRATPLPPPRAAGTDDRRGGSGGAKRRDSDSRRGKGTDSPSAADRATSAGGGSAQPAATQSESKARVDASRPTSCPR